MPRITTLLLLLFLKTSTSINVHNTQTDTILTTIQEYTSNSKTAIHVQASPEEDLEAEITSLNVQLVANPTTCQVVGTQNMLYTFMNGEFDTLRTEIGDDTTGIDFFTKDILEFNSTDYQSCNSPDLITNTSELTCLQTTRRATTKCKSELEWQFPTLKATDAKPKTNKYKIKFEMEMGVISNQTHLYNEMVYSTGFHHRLAMKTIKVELQLPKKFKLNEIVIMGNSRDSSYGSTYDETTGIVTFIRKTYLAPMNRYTVRVWYPTSKNTLSCAPCSRIDDWLMIALLVPFFLCFIIPCCAHLYGRDDVKRSGPRTRDGELDEPRFAGEGNTLGGNGRNSINDEDDRMNTSFCGCCCETPRDEDGNLIDNESRQPLMVGSNGGSDGDSI